jgi:antitoxin component of MazEF toxin-antitoxin module
MARPDNDQTGIRKLSMVGGKSFAVSLPVDVIKQLGWRKGTTLMVRRQGDKVIIEKVIEKVGEA